MDPDPNNILGYERIRNPDCNPLLQRLIVFPDFLWILIQTFLLRNRIQRIRIRNPGWKLSLHYGGSLFPCFNGSGSEQVSRVWTDPKHWLEALSSLRRLIVCPIFIDPDPNLLVKIPDLTNPDPQPWMEVCLWIRTRFPGKNGSATLGGSSLFITEAHCFRFQTLLDPSKIPG